MATTTEFLISEVFTDIAGRFDERSAYVSEPAKDDDPVAEDTSFWGHPGWSPYTHERT